MPDPLPLPWSVLKLLRRAAEHLEEQGIDSPRAAAEILLAHALGCRRIDLYLRHDQPVEAAERDRFRDLVRRRLRREPVAYITGFREFWSLPLAVDPSVLIPRPETECLVEAALAVLPRSTVPQPRRILDLGTGSGAVVLALAKERPGHRFVASDCSAAAIAIARSNARRLALLDRLEIVVGDWFAPFRPCRAWDLIVSNPPYIAAPILDGLAPEVAAFEPRLALDGGLDGLDCLRRLIAEAPAHLSSGGFLILEIGADQRRPVRDLAQQTAAYQCIDFRADYAGRDRVAILRKG
ncbi:MAG TPA: peptide chain release factor N(5)-glutamine methyltransferase [Desulfobacteraceae bacterium]|nr:peptide chain release factor N(5)-glutamine methyltransferase [Desulfobacteraceae bacterium]